MTNSHSLLRLVLKVSNWSLSKYDCHVWRWSDLILWDIMWGWLCPEEDLVQTEVRHGLFGMVGPMGGWLHGILWSCMAWLGAWDGGALYGLTEWGWARNEGPTMPGFTLHPPCNGSTLYVPYKIFPAFTKVDWAQRSWYSTVPEGGGGTGVKGQVEHT